MIHYRFEMMIVTAICTLAAAGGIAAELPQDLIDCRELRSAVERLDCYDQAVDSHKRPVVEAAAPAPKAAPAAASTAAVEPDSTLSQEELFGKNMEEVKESVQEATGTKELDEIEAFVTSIRPSAGGKAIITLDNGQVWTQIDNSRLRLSSYDRITIRRASLGSYMLRKVGSKTPMRVKRIS